MLIDRTHRGWAIGSAIAVGAAGAGYVAITAGGREWSGGSSVGLAYGIAGFAMMIAAGLLSARKKVRLWRIGRAQTWMRAHLWLGLISFPVILLHAGFSFGGPLTQMMMWSFVIVTVSGVAGAALQHYLPSLMMSRIPMETIYEQIPRVRSQLLVEADAIVASACGSLTVVADPAAERTHAAASSLQTAVRVDAEPSAPLREFYLADMRPFVAAPSQAHHLSDRPRAEQLFARLKTLLPSELHQAVVDLENVCEEERQLMRQETLHMWLHGWLLAHVPLSFALLALAVIHVFMALRY